MDRHRRRGTAVLNKGRVRSVAILDAATRILIDEGYARLSTRKIAAEAGIRPGHLQYYYRTKQDVVRALLERYLARSVAAVEARVRDAAGTPAARLRAIVDGILADQTDDGCRVFWEIWALAARDPAVADAARVFYERYRDELARAIAAVRPRRSPADARQRATMAVALLEGLTVFRLGAARSTPTTPRFQRALQAAVLRLAEETDP